jgi:hypothetical protein
LNDDVTSMPKRRFFTRSRRDVQATASMGLPAIISVDAPSGRPIIAYMR